MNRNLELLRSLKAGEKLNVYIRAPGKFIGREAEFSDRIRICFYDCLAERDAFRTAKNAEDAIRIVTERYPDCHFRDGLSAKEINPNPQSNDPSDYVVSFLFFADAGYLLRTEMEPHRPVVAFAAGVVDWYVTLRETQITGDQQ
jgi:hypothetical protein